MDRPKVYIVDDSLVFRAMLETMVSREPAFEICGIAANAEEASAEIGWLLPDIVLLDLNMPGRSGLALLDEIVAHWHHMNVVIVSVDARHGSEVCEQALRRGASACFDKAQVIGSGRELIELIYELAMGGEQRVKPYGRAISLPLGPH